VHKVSRETVHVECSDAPFLLEMVEEEENVAELQFGKEFLGSDVTFLMNDEVLVLLEKHKLAQEGKISSRNE